MKLCKSRLEGWLGPLMTAVIAAWIVSNPAAVHAQVDSDTQTAKGRTNSDEVSTSTAAAGKNDRPAAPPEAVTMPEIPTTKEATAPKKKEDTEEITITGFRASLLNALDTRRVAVTSRESVFAGDLAKIPDLNLAEAIQRVPGVAISREGGEGRQITLRGLGSEFTKATLNGMEVPASTDGLDSSGGLNAGRAFDFNVFASELFNRIDINKSYRAELEEGGLAGTVQLYTPRPFDKKGTRVTVAAKGGFNTLTQAFDPRVAVLASQTFWDDRVGVLASVAYTQRTVRQEGFGTVRWQSPNNNNRPWADSSETIVNGTLLPGFQIEDVQVPRLPRLDYFGNDQKRLGITGSLQFKPFDNVEITFDYVRSQFENRRESYNFDAQFRNFFDTITPVSLTLAPDGRSAVAGTFNDVLNRTESRLTEGETIFNQYVGNIDIKLDETKKLHLIAGFAQAEAISRQYRFNIITENTHQFGYDFAAGDPNFPTLTYGYDILDPSFYEWSGSTIRGNDVFRDNFTVGADFDWSIGLTSIKAGVIYNDRTVDAQESNAMSTQPERSVLASVTRPVPVSNFGAGIAPGGVPRSFLTNDLDATIDAYQVGPFVLDEFDGQTFIINERVVSGYIEINGEAELLGRPLRVNGGIRIARTHQTSNGSVADSTTDSGFSPVEIERDYVDVLPAANFVWEPVDDLLFRLGISRTMTRPGLGSLSPSFSVSPVNQTFSGGNPILDPIRSNNVDVALEWYFNARSVLGLSVFYKDIESFIATDSREGLLDEQFQELVRNDENFDPSFGDPATTPYTITAPVNNDGAELGGFEIAYQQQLTFLPWFLEDLGVILNYTFVNAKSVYGTGGNVIRADLIGLSKHSYNATVYYENEVDGFGGRVSINGRSDYVTAVPGNNGGPAGNLSENTDGSLNIDFLFYYDIIENITVTLEAFNLTDNKERLYTTGDGTENLVREYNHTGRQFFLGLRARL